MSQTIHSFVVKPIGTKPLSPAEYIGPPERLKAASGIVTGMVISLVAWAAVATAVIIYYLA